MSGLLEGKVAVITGGSKGIGAKAAEMFVQEGANVVITGRNQDQLDKTVEYLKGLGGKALGVQADSKSVEDCKKVFEETVKEFGQVDVLVNNAGVSSMQTIDMITDEEWERVIYTNQKGVLNYCREAIKYFTPKMKGSIINVSSTTSLRPLGGIAYVSSKWAINGMTRAIGLQYAGTGIRCNAVCPGPTITDMNTESESGELKNDAFNELIARRVDLTVGYCQPIDQARTILFLASDLSDGLNGVVFACDRGFSI